MGVGVCKRCIVSSCNFRRWCVFAFICVCMYVPPRVCYVIHHLCQSDHTLAQKHLIIFKTFSWLHSKTYLDFSCPYCRNFTRSWLSYVASYCLKQYWIDNPSFLLLTFISVFRSCLNIINTCGECDVLSEIPVKSLIVTFLCSAILLVSHMYLFNFDDNFGMIFESLEQRKRCWWWAR